jgi:hypothetical protein
MKTDYLLRALRHSWVWMLEKWHGADGAEAKALFHFE